MREDEVAYLVVEMRRGCQDARRKLIEAHIGLVVGAGRQNKDRSEVHSACYLGLVEAVDNFPGDLAPEKFSGYLKGAVEHVAIDVYRDEMRHTARLKKKYAHGSQSQVVSYLTKMDSGQWLKVVTKAKSAPKVTALNEFDAMDSVLVLVENELERNVVSLKAEGRSNKEVALTLGVSEQRVGRVLYELERRYQEKNP